MTSRAPLAPATPDALITDFFQHTAGEWRSERRYYTLPEGKTQEVISRVSIRYLPHGCDELIYLGRLHYLDAPDAIACGSYVTWDSTDVHTNRQISEGTTIFGAVGNRLYRDRGYATLKPVVAYFKTPDAQTLQLRTEYNGCSFEEEIKLVGSHYRTRQTIMTKAGEQQLIGQYLETRLCQS